MLDPKKIEQLAEQITSAIPPQIKSIADNVEGKIKTVLQAKLAELDVVSREEFDVQTQVLARTRQKLETLEQELESIRQKLDGDKD